MSHYKNVILVQPPEKSAFDFGGFSLGVLAASVRDIADISIVDTTYMSMEDGTKAVLERKPDLVGITVMGYPSVTTVATFIRLLRKEIAFGNNGPNSIPVIVGGHGATMLPEELLEAGADAVVFSEGETTFRAILQTGLNPGMPGTIIKKDGQLQKGPAPQFVDPLDDLKPPARDLMAPPAQGIHLLETSRGCPHQCKFCETTRFFGLRWRAQTPERVVRETLRLLDEYNGFLIQIADDNFTVNTKRLKEICRQLIEAHALPAYFMLSARADDLIRDPELLPLMAEARMLRITMGIDTLDPVVSEAVQKTITIETYRTAFDRMRELGFFGIASIIVGLPGETPEARAKTVERVIQAGPDSAQFLPYIPLPGLPREDRHIGYMPNEEDSRDAHAFTVEFFRSPEVTDRLKKLMERDTIQGQMARGTYEKALRREKRKANFR